MTYYGLKTYQPEIVKILQKGLEKERLVHAYLFEGSKGTKKMDAAFFFASMLLCTADNKPCGKCTNCKQILSKQHSNLYIVEPQNNIIRKDQIEELLHELSSTSLIEGSRIYIIKDAELMNASAANALLKFLEEPHPHHYLLLLSSNPNALLDTIKSRVQSLRFKPLSINKMTASLISKGIKKDIAYSLAHLTSSEEEADALVSDGVITEIVNLVIEIQKVKNRNKDSYLKMFEKGRFLYQERSNIHVHQMFFEVFMLMVREKIKYLNNINDVYFLDCIKDVNESTESIDTAINQLETLSQYQERLKYNVNMELLYSSMFLDL